MRSSLVSALALAALAGPALAQSDPAASGKAVQIGPRPYHLVGILEDGPLKEKLTACFDQEMEPKLFSIGHRGAPLQFPEHTVEGNRAAARMGAGALECDVAFTADKELVCRHAQNDLHTSTNILGTDLAVKCAQGFAPASKGTEASAECRTSDITLAEFKTLHGKMDGADPAATTVEAYMAGTAPWRTTLYEPGTLMTHAESIALFKSLGTKFTPELKEAVVEMPFDGFTQEMYAQKLVDEYKAAGIPAADVWPQSFNLDDVLYWVEHEPEFGAQAVFLVDPDTIEGFDNMDPATWGHDMADLKARGVNYVAPALFVLVTSENGEIVPSEYAKAAKAAGLNLITWTLERSGPLDAGGGWYYQSIEDLVNDDGDMLRLLDVLAQQVGVVGVFSDWPATVTFYANCMGLN